MLNSIKACITYHRIGYVVLMHFSFLEETYFKLDDSKHIIVEKDGTR